MRAITVGFLPVTLLLVALSSPALAQREALQTDDLRLIYVKPTLGYLAPHVARCFQNSLAFHRKLWDYDPSQKVTVVLNDFGDAGNAGAGTVPRNFLSLETSPLSVAYETLTVNERMNFMMNHELVHITAQDQAAGADRFFRGLFSGKVTPVSAHPESILYFYLTAPRAAAPRWYQEGIAVFIETWMAGGLGRAQGAYDEMVFRSKVADGSRFYDPLGLMAEGTHVDFQVGVNNYLYGTRFLTYLAYTYSPEELMRWVTRTDGTKRYFSAQFEKVFGKSLNVAWQDWIEWEHEFQEKNLAAIHRYPVTEYTDLSPRALGSVSRAYLDAESDRLYGAFNYPGVVGHVGAISVDDGSAERIVDVKQPSIFTVTSLAYDPASETIFYTTDNYAYRDLVSVNVETGETATLMKDARIGQLVFNRADRALWGTRHFNGIVTLVRVPHPYTQWKQIHSWPYGEVMYDLDISPDGRLLSGSVGEIDGRHELRVFEIEKLLEGEVTSVAEVDFGVALPLNFSFSPDGRYLYGSSYYTGASNIFRYEHATDDLEAVTNTETGFFRPIPLGDDDLIVFRYTGEGFVPARLEDAKPLEDVSPTVFLGNQLVEKHPVVKDWMLGSPADVPLDSMITGEGAYRSVSSIGLESLYPVVLGYKDSAALGLRLNLSDPAFMNRIGLSASYSPEGDLPESERWHVNAEFERYDWRLSYWHNYADFYDLFGPTKRSRRGDALGLGYTSILVYDEPRQLELEVDGTYYWGLEELPGFQGVSVTADAFFTAQAKLGYENLRHSLGHVDEEKGHSWDLVFAGDLVEEKLFPKFLANFDLGFALPIQHSSIWLRTSAGYSPTDRDDPFSNFFFGGFGNNWVDYRDEKRYREFYAFPGIEISNLFGSNYAKGTAEWNLPPRRFDGVGNSAFYLSWARAALFASGIATNLDESALRREVANVGAQLDFQFTLLSRLEMMLSVGQAVAFENGVKPRYETMVSLKVLR